MRSFEERKEEIFRRSEKRIIQRRKNTWRLIVTCVPLVLCVGIASGYLALGGFGRMDSAAPEAALDPYYSIQDSYAGNGEAMPESPECMPEFAHEAVSLQISDGNQSKTYTQQQILDTFQCMLTVLQEEVTDNTGIPDVPESIDEPKTEGNFSANGASEYSLILTRSDGSQEVYNITDGVLTGPYGAYELTDSQFMWIRNILEDED